MAYSTMNGMIVPSVSAGSSQRAARDAWTPQVMTPSGAAWSMRAGARRRHASATTVIGLIEGKAVETSHVLPDDLPPLLLGDSFEVALDDLPRMWPGRHRVRIVRGPHDVLDPDELTARHANPIVDERRVDLPPEVFAGRERQRGRVEVAILVLRLIELLEEERNPADFVLCGNELEMREPLEHAGEDQHDQGPLNLVTEHGRAQIAVQRLLDRQAAFGAHAGDAVQAQRHLELLRRRPERIIVGGAVRPRRGRRSPDGGALEPARGAPGKLLHAVVDVVEGDQGEPGESFRRVGAVLGQPVVVDTKAGALQRRVGEPELAKPKRGVDDVRLDAVEIHVLHTLGGVPAARSGVLIGRSLKEARELLRFLPGSHDLGEMGGRNTLEQQVGAGLLSGQVLHHSWSAVTKLLLDTLQPEVARLVHVRIGGNQPQLAHDRPPHRAW